MDRWNRRASNLSCSDQGIIMANISRSTGIVLASVALGSTQRYSVDMQGVDRLALQLVYSDAAPPAKTFVDADVNVSTNIITIAAHGFVNGTKVAATTSGVLPGGLSATNYWVIYVSATTIKLASSLANAEAGTAVDITSAAGGGTHTLTPATSAGNIAKVQVSSDNSNWSDLGSYTVTIATTSGNSSFEIGQLNSKYVSVLYTPSAGQVNLAINASYVR